MLLNPGTAIELSPDLEGLPDFGPLHKLLASWAQAGFSKEQCRNIFDKYLEDFRLSGHNALNPTTFETDRPLGTDQLLYFSQTKKWVFGFSTHCQQRSQLDLQARIPSRLVKPLARLVESIAASHDLSTLRKNFDFFSRADLNLVFQTRAQARQASPVWPSAEKPGIYRREHASVVISSGKTQVLFDPIFLSPSGPPKVTWLRPDFHRIAPPDAVLITHSHDDHWHIPSILASLHGSNGRVFVPEVPVPTYLCSDFSAQLRAAGLPHKTAKWGDCLRVGDIEIDVLPFYGEQPAADVSPLDPNIRNWGNCFRVNTPQFSAFILVDSGRDVMGDMSDVIRDSVRQRGPADAVLACMREFYSPFKIQGLQKYCLSLTFSQLRSLYKQYRAGRLRSCTAGLDEKRGIAALCSDAKATCFLPYAQGFDGIGKPTPSGAWGPTTGLDLRSGRTGKSLSEKMAMAKLAGQLRERKSSTIAQEWNPGDRVYFRNKDVVRERFDGVG